MSISDTIKQYYPQNIEAFSKEYESSKEYSALVEKVTLSQKFPEYRNRIFDRLVESLPSDVDVVDDTKLQFLDRCFTFQIKNKQDARQTNWDELIYCISILGPFCSKFKKAVQRIHDESGNIIGYISDVDFSLDENESPDNCVNILRDISTSFKLQEITAEVFTTPCPGHSIFGISSEEFTVFNGLFKDQF